MAFLTLNGMTIPIAKGGQVQPQIIGEYARAFNGGLLCDNRGSKRSWKFRTSALKQSDAEIVRGLLMSLGDVFPFDASYYSSKGMAPVSTPVGCTFHAALAADGRAVYEVSTGGTVATASKIGSDSIAIEAATTNLLSADARDAENAATGYGAIAGGTLAADVVYYWQGAKSLKVTPAGAASGAGSFFDPGAGSATKTYMGSVYVCGTAGHKIRVGLYDQTNTVVGPTFVLTVPASNVWYRVPCSMTIGAVDCRALWLTVLADDAACGVYYSDGWQIEESSVVTSWVDGARVEGHLEYPIDPFRGKNGVTMSMWMRALSPTSPIARELLILELNATQWWECFIIATTTTLRVAYGGAHTIDIAGCCDGAWHHIVSTLNPNPATGEHYLQAWKDGVSMGYIDHAAEAFDTTSATFHIGSFSSTGLGPSGVLMDDIHAFPFPCSTALAAALYAATSSTFGMPNTIAAGDAIQETGGVAVRGIVESDAYAQLMDGATWRPNMRRVDFRLEEV